MYLLCLLDVSSVFLSFGALDSRWLCDDLTVFVDVVRNQTFYEPSVDLAVLELPNCRNGLFLIISLVSRGERGFSAY